MQELEYHKLLFRITISKAEMMIRFPCSLAFQITSSNYSSDQPVSQLHELKSGQCTIDQQLTLALDIPFQDKYPELKFTISANMQSSNGKIPAGKATLHLTLQSSLETQSLGEYQNKEKTSLKIDKCPDKNAKIHIMHEVQFIEKYFKSAQVNSQSSQESSRMSNLLRYRDSRSPIRGFADTSFKSSGNDSRIQEITDRYPHYKAQKYEDEKSDRKYDLETRRQKLRSTQQSNLRALQRQKSAYRKEIGKIKDELFQPNRQALNKIHESKIHMLEEENQKLYQQISSYKQKLRGAERKTRDLQHNLKSSKQQLQKAIIKSEKNEKQNVELIGMIDLKQMSIKHLTQELKVLKQQYQDLKLTLSAQEKKLQVKELSLKEEIKQLSIKCKGNERERQKATHQLSELLNEYEKNQHQHQNDRKQRTMQYLQEKNKLNKRMEQVTATNEDLTDEVYRLKGRVSELQLSLKYSERQNQELKKQMQESKSKISELTQQLKGAQSSNHKHEILITELQQIEGLYTQLKKKEQTLIEQNKKITQETKLLQLKAKDLGFSFKELQNQVEILEKEKKSLLFTNQSLLSENTSNKKQLVTYEDNMEKIKQEKTAIEAKLGDLRTRFEEQATHHTQVINKLQTQLLYTKKKRQQQESEAEATNYKLQKTEEQLQVLASKISSLNQNIIELSTENSKQNERYRNLEQVNQNVQKEKQCLQSKLLSLQSRQKQLQKQIKRLNELQHGYKKTSKQRETEIYILKEKYNQQQIYFNENKQLLEQEIKEMKDNIEKVENKNKQLKDQVNELQEEIERNKIVVERMEEQQSQSQQRIDNLTQSNSELEIQNEGWKSKLNTIETASTALKDKVQDLYAKFTEKCDDYQQLQSEVELERKKNQTALKFLQTYLSNKHKRFLNKQLEGQQEQENQCLFFEDDEMQKIQDNIIKESLEFMKKLQAQTQTIIHELQSKIIRLEKQGKYLESEKEQLASQLNKQKEDSLQLNQHQTNQIKQLKENSLVLQEAVHQLRTQQERLQSNKKLLESQIKVMQDQHENKTQSIRILQRENEKIKSELEDLEKQKSRFKHNSESQAQKMASQYQQTIQSCRDDIASLEDKNSNLKDELEKINTEYIQLQSKLKESDYHATKLEEGLSDEKNRSSELDNQRQILSEKLEHQQVKSKSLTALIEQKEREILELNGKIVEYEHNIDLRTKELHGKNSEASYFQKEIQTLKKKIEQRQEEFRKQTAKIKGQMQSILQENKQLKQNIILFKNDIDLKGYEIQQRSNSIETQKRSNEELSASLQKQKEKYHQLQHQHQLLKNQVSFLHANLKNISEEKQTLETLNLQMKEANKELHGQVEEKDEVIKLLEEREMDLRRLKQAYAQLQCQLQQQLQVHAQNTEEWKEQLDGKQEEVQQLKFLLQELNSELQTHISEQQHKMLQNSALHEQILNKNKSQFTKEIEELRQINRMLKFELETVRSQYQLECEEYRNECADLREFLEEREEVIMDQNEEIKAKKKRINLLTSEVKQCLEAWQNEKGQSVKRSTSFKILQKYKQDVDGYEHKAQLSSQNSQKLIKSRQQMLDEISESCKNILNKHQLSPESPNNNNRIKSQNNENQSESPIIASSLNGSPGSSHQ